MTHDITNLMDHYRVVACLVWNTGFRQVPELRTWRTQEHFGKIKELLFAGLVSARVQDPTDPLGESMTNSSYYRVVPLGTDQVPIMIHRPRPGDLNRYWDDPICTIRSSEAEMCFVDYFDWDEMDYIDFQYYRVRIQSFPSQPQLIGREALLQHHDARVFLSPALNGKADLRGSGFVQNHD